MIIDIILDRKDGVPYNANKFYRDCMEYSRIFDGIGDEITRAMDFGEERDVRGALCAYIIKNGYNPAVCDYVCSANWLPAE